MRPLTAGVLRNANRAHQLLREMGRTELADRIMAEAGRWNDNSLVVVVAGDIKRGKSSLLNSIVGQQSLLPVDADVATSVHLVVRHGPAPRIEVTKLDEDGRASTFEIDDRRADRLRVDAGRRGVASRRHQRRRDP